LSRDLRIDSPFMQIWTFMRLVGTVPAYLLTISQMLRILNVMLT